MGNNPVNFNDPSGHDWVCTGANNDHCYDDGNGTISGMVSELGGGNSNEEIEDDLQIEDFGDEIIDYIGNMATYWAENPLVKSSWLLPRELGSAYYSYTIRFSSAQIKYLSQISKFAGLFGFLFQALPAQVENFSDPSGVSGSNVLADLLVDGAIFGLSAIAGGLVFAVGTSSTLGWGAPISAVAAIGASALVSATLNNLVDNSDFRSDVADVLAATQANNPDQSLAIPVPIAPVGTPCPFGC